MENVWKRRLMNFWRGWVRPLLLVGIVLGSFRSAVADWNDVPTGSMKPTLLEGDRIVVNKLAYGLRVPFSGWWVSRWGEPQRGDVVICFAPDTGDRLVKRVVGLPGDVVELRDQQLLVNGQAMVYETLDRDFIEQIEADQRHRHRFAAERLGDRLHPVMATPAIPAARSFGPITVPPDHYFMMGDNRDNSRDSRFFGCIHRDRIVGRARAVALSLDRNHYYKPRWSRFFKGVP